jgi:hypothetical protein
MAGAALTFEDVVRSLQPEMRKRSPLSALGADPKKMLEFPFKMNVSGAYFPFSEDNTPEVFVRDLPFISRELKRQRRSFPYGDFMIFGPNPSFGTLIHETAHRGIDFTKPEFERAAIYDKKGRRRFLSGEDWARIIELIATSRDPEINREAKKYFSKRGFDVDELIKNPSVLAGVSLAQSRAQDILTESGEFGPDELIQNFPHEGQLLDTMMGKR